MSRTYRRSQLDRSIEGQYNWLKSFYRCWNYDHRSDEEIWAEAEIEYRQSTMDGRWSESGRKSAFKNKCSRHLRRQNAIYCKNAAASEDFYEETSAPRRRDTSTFAWDFF
jgi:hypothetical protein